jgi:hypothetical protein
MSRETQNPFTIIIEIGYAYVGALQLVVPNVLDGSNGQGFDSQSLPDRKGSPSQRGYRINHPISRQIVRFLNPLLIICLLLMVVIG